MRMGYTKLFQEIIMSTVWREPDHVRLLWITMLALKDRWHVVNASLPGLADSARITIAECEDALKALSGPDPHSRTKEHEGRRIEECDGGWIILNGEKYRNKMSLDERREYQRIKQKEYRDRKKDVKSCQQSSQQFTHTDTDTDTDLNNIWVHYPKRSGANPKKKAEKALNARLKEGIDIKTIEAGVKRYKAFCEATGKIGTEYIMQAATFLGPDRHFENQWEIPKVEKKADIEKLAAQHARPGESLDQFKQRWAKQRAN